MKTKTRLLLALLAAVLLIGGVAAADPGRVGKVLVTQTRVKKTSVTALAGNQNRRAWCIEAAGPLGANSVTVWYTVQSTAGTAKVRVATTANGEAIGGSAVAAFCDDGANGYVYAGAVTVIGSSTASLPYVTTREW